MTISLLFMAINFCHAQRVMSAEEVIRSSGGRISFFEGEVSSSGGIKYSTEYDLRPVSILLSIKFGLR